MRVLDLFSGIGGFSLGLERAGMTTVAFCEIDPFCRQVLRKHWPDVPIFEDVRELTADAVGPVDVICGGFPCQDISVAGGGAGIRGERSGLWREFARLVGELRPGFVIVENVAALLGRGLGDVLGDLAALRYDAEWASIPTGLPYGHERERVFVVAYPDGTGLPAPGEYRSATEQASPIVAPILAASGVSRPQPAPAVVRSVHGIPARPHRIAALGNAVVPQVVETIGRAIMSASGDMK